jgi:UDP-N-acetylglucosamine acyltransferase
VIDPRAIIDPNARLAPNVTVSPGAIIGPDVEIGDGSWIGPYVVIKGPTKIGERNKIYQFASIGEDPQDRKYAGERTYLEIGNDNVIREYVTINRGTVQGGGITRLGNNNLLMACVHIAHDCIIHNNVVFANYSALAGHVTVHDHVIMGGYSGVHQFCTVGHYSFIAMSTYIRKDVLPYLMVSGTDATIYGLNAEGLKRHEFSSSTISQLKAAYRIIFRDGLTVAEAVQRLQDMVSDCPEITRFILGLESSTRGITR